MMRSLFSGVAGLKTHQTRMDVIGNNIANVNTVAFKSSSMTFSELMSQTTQKASGPNANTGTGGINARQIGLGVKAGAINTSITTQGASQNTGNPFDIMITGNNFFVVNNGQENFFTRDGSFYVDGAGNLAMTSTGYNVMGWGVDDETMDIKQDNVTALRIMSAANMSYPPEATSKAYVSGILDKNDKDVGSASGLSINLNLFDELGYSYTAKLTFKQSDNENNYSVEFTQLLDSKGNKVDISAMQFGEANTKQEREMKLSMNTANYKWVGTALQNTEGVTVFELKDLFEPNGELKAPETEITMSGQPATVQDALNTLANVYGYEGSEDEFYNMYFNSAAGDGTIVTMTQMLANLATGANTEDVFPTDKESFTVAGRTYTGTTIDFNPNNGKFNGIGGSAIDSDIVLGLSALGGQFRDIEIDFSECSMHDNKGTSTLGATSGDFNGLGTGRRLGDMIGVSIQNDGMIYASYDNGMTKLLGQIATAEFANASGLEKQGDNLYSATLNSGDFDGVGVDITANGGYMSTGQLEMSNVDLSSEFTEMITTQRGFQANSRIITVSDTLLEELTNLKR